MKKMTVCSQNNYIEIDSDDVKNIIEACDGISEVINMSQSTGENIMAFDVILSSDYIEDLLRNQMGEIDYSSDDEQEAVLFEQAEYISDALLDNMRAFMESRYNVDNYHQAYDIYKSSLEEGIRLTLTLSFKEVKHGRLYRVASSLNNKNSELK